MSVTPDRSPRHGATIYSSRLGCYARCGCGWTSDHYRSTAAASLAWSEHIANPDTSLVEETK
jgi:hypothetical protein